MLEGGVGMEDFKNFFAIHSFFIPLLDAKFSSRGDRDEEFSGFFAIS